MADYSQEIAFTNEIIAEFGADIIVRRNSSAAPIDPNKPWLGNTIANIDYTVKSVIFSVKNEYVSDDLVRLGDQYCLIAGSAISIVPNPKDRIINLGREFEIIKVVNINPANQKILFKVYFRGQEVDS